MLNRMLQVRIVRVNKADKPAEIEDKFESKVAILSYYAERVAEKTAGAIVTYIVLDTVRQILVARANRP